ncbi:hypothetical protein [Streptomyces clavuligerus]|uniref:hypothetical protein n=1 Tax=Streptomyces clavuligerus TaxID=1901 RepID=UPI001E3AD960|nr:hypothetical protein [Streptomyces clavuligerus]
MSGIESPVTNTVPDSLNGHPWGVLIPWDQQVREDTLAVIDRACPPGSRLHDPVRAIVTTALQQQGPLSNRLFALAVLGAISGNPAPAVPVAVASTLWFAGTEALDDLVDAARATTAAPMNSSSAASCAWASCPRRPSKDPASPRNSPAAGGVTSAGAPSPRAPDNSTTPHATARR